MTTTRTPYDAEIAECGRQSIEAKYKYQREDALMGLTALRHQAAGYRRAVAGYAGLLVAAEELDRNMGCIQTAGWVKLRAAIRKAKGEQP